MNDIIKITHPKAILFDLDGTLVDSAPDFESVVNSLRADEGLAPLPYQAIREQVSNGGVALASIAFNIDKTHDDIMHYRQRVLDRYQENIGSHSGYFAGFEQVLSTLEQHQIQWGIVTNKPRLYAELLVERLDIHAPVMVCPDDVVNKKPHPEPLFKAANALNVAAEDCWYVGDHARDIESAIAAKMPSIAALFGYIEPHVDPKDWQADYYIDTPLELLTLLSL